MKITLSGCGVVQGNVLPGIGPAAIFMGGDVAFAASSVLEIEIAGVNQNDCLVVAGSLHAGGTLRVSLLNGFVPVEHDRFYLLFSPDIGGSFATIELPDLPPSLAWNAFNLHSNGYIETYGVSPPPGDFDGDHDVDGADFVWWQTNFPTAAAPAVAPVPEPAGFFVGIVGAAAIVFSGFGRARFKSANLC